MIDLFETIFIWSIYVVLPLLLIIRFLGRHRAGFLFAGILALYSPDDIYSINFPTEIESSIAIEQIREGDKSGFVNSNRDSSSRSANSDSTGQAANSESTSGKPKRFPGPRFPWGADPTFRNTDSGMVCGPHKLSAARDWINDPAAWEND